MVFSRQRGRDERLLVARASHHGGPHVSEHDADIHPGALQMLQQRRRIGTVLRSVAIERHGTGRRRVRHQQPLSARHRRQSARLHVRPRRTAHRPLERIVSARIQNHDPRPGVRHRAQHRIERNRLQRHRRRRRKPGVDRDQIVRAVHLHPVTRVEQQRHVRTGTGLRQFTERVVHRVFVRVPQYRHVEADAFQRSPDGLRVAHRIRQRTGLLVRAVAHDQRDTPGGLRHRRYEPREHDGQQRPAEPREAATTVTPFHAVTIHALHPRTRRDFQLAPSAPAPDTARQPNPCSRPGRPVRPECRDAVPIDPSVSRSQRPRLQPNRPNQSAPE